ncbi:hypothetical protein HDU93_009557 [Gonapodya sp. JEL0774]|nr:hypothetical protein HDU93_009557 [Gonapodya sp. JEL0774]
METPRRRARSPVGSAVSAGSESQANDAARRRSAKRDDAIRRKAEKDLSSRSQRRRTDLSRRAGAGEISATVKNLNPSEAFTVLANTNCMDVAQLMAAKRTDCVLVVDTRTGSASGKVTNGKLLGIFTAKDLTFRVAGAGLSPAATLVSSVMTPNPTTVTSKQEASEALNIMTAGHFRHLPVVEEPDHEDGESRLTGVLDVTKVMKDGMERLDRAAEQSRKLKEALDALESEWSINAVHIAQYSDVLRDRLTAPTMMSVITEQSHETPIVNIRANVKDAIMVMKETKQTGVSIVDDERNLAGILTTKDVVLRVIAAGLEPERTAVVRVMTPKPDAVQSDLTILDGLKKMHGEH